MATLLAMFETVICQSPKRPEIGNKPQSNKEAPAEAIAAFRDFFAYINKAEPDIVSDETAQERWLTKRMRDAFAGHIKRSGSPDQNPDFPSNQTFLQVWNNPTSYMIAGSRHYDHRNPKIQTTIGRLLMCCMNEMPSRTGLKINIPVRNGFIRSSLRLKTESGSWLTFTRLMTMALQPKV